MQKLLLLAILIILLFPVIADAQEIKFEGTHTPDSTVLKLLDDYSRMFENHTTVAERDAKRKALLSPGYFYHGMDGAPISLEGLTNRQTKNQFKLIADSVYDRIFYQYENTAIFIFKEWQHLFDKGVEKKGVNSVLIVFSKENGQWKVLSDIIGQKPIITPPSATNK
ncbi:MAG: hypothetical protein H7Y86_20425 [Rhizobacter sp.]|nr:hypothetical protein [Ferruginibacter sp.]